MTKLARLLAGLAIFAFFVWAAGRAADQEFASAGGVLEERGESVTAGQVDTRQVAATPRSSSACGASSIGPDGRVTVTVCGEGLSERAAGERTPLGKQSTAARGNSHPARSESLYQGKPVRWWARRAVQARKDANARARTIRRLQTTARRQLAYPTGHWLDGAFLCIHRYERGGAGWATNTGNGYRGGLQFDSSFARTYGPAWAFRAFGGVERWPASVQITAAVQAWVSRGFGPWPSTRLMCGL